MTSENTTTPQLRAACYCRISSDPHDKREGVDRQRTDTAILCELKGWQIAGVYIDNDRSASNGKKRPEWDRLLADVAAGKIDAVAAWDQDRVNRTMDDFMAYKSLFVARGIKLATSNNGDLDLSTPAGMMTATIKTAVSTHEIDMMKIRMKRAAAHKAVQGIPKWRHAFGYRQGVDGLELDPKTAALVQQGYAAILAGSTLNDVARIFNDAGAHGLTGKPWTPSTVSLFMRAPRNAGLRSHSHDGMSEIVGKGMWPALVEKSTWESAQAVMNAPGRKPGRKSVRRHLLTGVLKCGKCGHHLAGGSTTTQGTRVYSCKGCRGVSISAEQVESLLYRIVAGRLAMPDAVDLLKSEVHDAEEAERIRVELAGLYAERQQIGVERAKRLLTGEQAHAATAYLNDQIAELERKQQDDERLRVFADIPLGSPAVFDKITRLAPGRYRAVIDLLMAVTIAPVKKGGYLVDPETKRKIIDERRVQVRWL
jgi:DNA invertase Pin-like site-specific DNA recombinase/ribosomal protein L37AE/L43A